MDDKATEKAFEASKGHFLKKTAEIAIDLSYLAQIFSSGAAAAYYYKKGSPKKEPEQLSDQEVSEYLNLAVPTIDKLRESFKAAGNYEIAMVALLFFSASCVKEMHQRLGGVKLDLSQLPKL